MPGDLFFLAVYLKNHRNRGSGRDSKNPNGISYPSPGLAQPWVPRPSSIERRRCSGVSRVAIHHPPPQALQACPNRRLQTKGCSNPWLGYGNPLGFYGNEARGSIVESLIALEKVMIQAA